MDIERPAPKQPLPDKAKRVFKGEIFDVYQWEQKMFDGTTATFEKLKRPDTVVVVPVDAKGGIILIEQEQPARPPFLSFPGGRVESGEEPAAAAKRELEEETGYTTNEDLVLWYATQPVGKIDWAVYVFVAHNCTPLAGGQRLDGGEKITLKFTRFEDLLELVSQMYLFDEGMILRLLRAKYESQEMRALKQLLGI